MRLDESLYYIFGQIHETLVSTLDGLDYPALVWRPDPEANTIAWLAWHLTRVEDSHVAEIAGIDQVWQDQPWARRFGLPSNYQAGGYGDSAEDVARIRPENVEVLVEYSRATTDMILGWLDAAREKDFERIIDQSYNPPVTVAVRLASVISDAFQHVGQAAYIRGMWERRED